MIALLEFRAPIPVETPLGRGYALFVEADAYVQYWTVVLDESAAFVTFRQSLIRAQNSYTHGRGITDDDMRDIVKHKEK